jgi:RNA recognition motif-containing protein
MKKLNIFIKGIPIHYDPKTLYKYLTQFGEIQSIHVPIKKDGTNAGFGFVLFERTEDNKALLERAEKGEKFTLEGDQALEFQKYQNENDRGSSSLKKNNIYLKEFSTRVLSEDESKN